MRVASLFKRLLGLAAGVRVTSVEIAENCGQEEVVVSLARRQRRKMRCSACGRSTRAIYDRRVSDWRHLDLFRVRCLLRAEVRRIDCPARGVVAEQVPWARAGSRFSSRDFEDSCAWLARDAPKSVVAELMRIDWETVGRMIQRVVTEALGQRDGLDGLRLLGVDEVSYRKGHRYLTVVVDQQRGAVVWCGEGRSATTLKGFFEALGPERACLIEAISVDMSASWQGVIAAHAPQARVCVDPFHVVALSGEALDALRRAEWQRLRADDPERAQWIKHTRFNLRRAPEDLSDAGRLDLACLAITNQDLYAGYLIHDQLRAIYQLPDPLEQAGMLDQWICMAAESGLAPFERLAATIDTHYTGIVAAMHTGLSNGRIEAMNSTVRLISHRSRGFRSLQSLLAMVQLVCGSIPLRLPRSGVLAVR